MSIKAVSTPQAVSFGEGEQQKSGKGGAVIRSAIVGGGAAAAGGYFFHQKKADAPYLVGLDNDKFDKSGIKEADSSVYESVKKLRAEHAEVDKAAATEVEDFFKGADGKAMTEMDVATYMEKADIEKPVEGGVQQVKTKEELNTYITEEKAKTSELQKAVTEAKEEAAKTKANEDLAANKKLIAQLEDHANIIKEEKIKPDAVKASIVKGKKTEIADKIMKELSKIADDKMPKFKSGKMALWYGLGGAALFGIIAAIAKGGKKTEQA